MLPRSKAYQFCRETIPSHAGSPEKTVYRRCVDVAGRRTLEAAGTKNTYREIQENVAGVTVADILARALVGDTTSYTADPSGFVDLTTAPKDLMEAQNMMIRSRDVFNSLPVDVRKEYGNRFGDWLAAVNDGSFVAKFGKKAKEDPAAKAAAQEAADKAEAARMKKLLEKYGGNT